MATSTAADIHQAALEFLGITGAGQTPEDEDRELAADAYDSVYRNLRRKNLLPFPQGEVPKWAKLALGKVVGIKMVGHFGITGDRYIVLKREAKEAMTELQGGSSPTRKQTRHADPGYM